MQENDKPDAAEKMGIEPVGRLLLRFSLPAITGMVVNALYNIVDRIYVGRGISEFALGGISLVMPITTISFAFSMLFGIGAANMISMRLGQNRRDEAENALNHCLALLFSAGLFLMIAGIIFLEPLLSILGAQEGSEALNFSRPYMRITFFGTPFMMIGFGMTHCTRAQGFPGITMITMLMGAVLNIILDPIFIFVLKMGVEGVAWATVISQTVSALWILIFLLRGKGILRFRLKSFKPSAKIIGQIMAFGSAQFLLNFIMSGVQLLTNASMGWYGAASLGVENGGDIALSAMNIIGSINMLILMPVFGINQGAQPILGYNYGAQQYRRVLKTYILAVGVSTIICVTGFTICELFTKEMVQLFAPSGSHVLINFTAWAMRVFVICMPLNGFQIVSSNFFIVTGRPKTSIFLTMLRQLIALVPCLLIFGRLWGVQGIVVSMPVADGFSFFLTGFLIFFELRKLRKEVKAVGKEQLAKSNEMLT